MSHISVNLVVVVVVVVVVCISHKHEPTIRLVFNKLQVHVTLHH